MPKFPLDEYKVSEQLSIDVGTRITIPPLDHRSYNGRNGTDNGHSASVRYEMTIGDNYPREGEVTINAHLNGKTPKETAEMLIETLEHALKTIKVQLSERGVL